MHSLVIMLEMPYQLLKTLGDFNLGSLKKTLPLLKMIAKCGCLVFNSSFAFPQFQSHQIFHVLVVAAAFVHFYGVSNLQEFRYGLEGGCTDDSLL